MSKLFQQGEIKTRPGTYHRISNVGSSPLAGAMDGVNALIMQAEWGPAGKVVKITDDTNLEETYGAGKGTDAAKAIFKGGANTVYIYRPEGTAGAKGTATISSLTVTAKYVGEHLLKIKVQEKPGDNTKKQLLVIDGTKIKETFTVDAGAAEAAAFVTAAEKSKYIDVKLSGEESASVDATESNLTGGKNPTVTVADYVEGFSILETYRFNVISTDTIEKNISVALNEYIKKAVEKGQFILGVTGQLLSVDYEDRLAEAKSYNNAYMVYLGNGYTDVFGSNVDGVNAVSYAAGAISSTPASQSIVHLIVDGATDVPEKLTDERYEAAIDNGMLMFSMGPDGQVWFDTQVNTLTMPADNQDHGWKKIRRVKTRNEVMDRVDRSVAPKAGRINCDSDGIASVIQTANGVMLKMVNENKLFSGSMTLDSRYPATPDSAWYVIAVDDKDSMEKIYLDYQFRYSQNA